MSNTDASDHLEWNLGSNYLIPSSADCTEAKALAYARILPHHAHHRTRGLEEASRLSQQKSDSHCSRATVRDPLSYIAPFTSESLFCCTLFPKRNSKKL